MAIANHLKKKMFILLNDQICKVLEHHHLKPGKGGAYLKTKLYDIVKKSTFEKTFRSEEKVNIIEVSYVEAEFLYEEGENLFFLNSINYEQYQVHKDFLGENYSFLIPNLKVTLALYNEEILEITLPASIEAEVTYTEDAVKGNTNTNPNKVAQLENGLEIQVPLFIKIGDWIKIDTKNKTYITRLQKKG